MAKVEDLNTALIVVLLIFLVYIFYHAEEADKKAMDRYESELVEKQSSKSFIEYMKFRDDLQDQLERHSIDSHDEMAIMKLVEEMVKEDMGYPKSQFKRISNSTIEGLVRGGLIGFITGGKDGALTGGLVFALANGLFKWYNINYPPEDELIDSN
jgi:hypothetical protein